MQNKTSAQIDQELTDAVELLEAKVVKLGNEKKRLDCN